MAVAVRVHAQGFDVLGRTEIKGFATRPAVDWGAEYSAFLRDLGVDHVASSLCIPRDEFVFRTIRLPSVGDGELAKAVALQVDDLHPYGSTDVCHDFAALTPRSPEASNRLVAVAVAEAARVRRYATAFEEAGVALSACTVPAGALRAISRSRRELRGRPFAIAVRLGSRLEIYGESEGSPCLSFAPDLGGITFRRALRLAHDGLRSRSADRIVLALLGDETPEEVPRGFEIRSEDALLALPETSPSDLALATDAIAVGAAVESALPRTGLGLNLLPRESRKSNSVRPLAPRLALLAAIVLLGAAFLVRPLAQDRVYVSRLRDATARLEASATRSLTEEAGLSESRGRYEWLVGRQGRTRADLELLRELARILPAATSLQSIRLDDVSFSVAGTSPDADSLLSLLAASPLLGDARFATSPTAGESGELFRIEVRKQ